MNLLSPSLIAFLAIVQHKTVHAAADSIHLTQTAVTQRIRVLERQLKTTLFIRSRKGMELTKEGQALLQYCQAAELLEGEALSKIQGAAVISTIQVIISGPNSIIHSRVIPACHALVKPFPNLLFHFDINDMEERHKTLARGLCDFAILHPEDISKEMKFKMLEPEEYVLVAPPAWKNRKLTSILAEERRIDFNPDDMMTINYLKQFDLYQHVQPERHYVNRTDSMAKMIMDGFGYGVLTTQFSEPYLREKKLIVLNQAKIYQHVVALAWFDRPEPPDYFSALINQIN